MDQVDLKILEILMDDVRTPIKAISSKVFLSPAAVSARINAMREEGILRKSRANVNPSALGYNLRCFIDVKVPLQKREEFETYVKQCSNIIEATYVTGEYSAFLKGAFSNIEQMNNIVKQLHQFGELNVKIGLERIVISRGISIPEDIFPSGEEDAGQSGA